MRVSAKWIVFLPVVFLLAAAPAAAQFPSTPGFGSSFSITGRVVEEPGVQPIEMALVTLRLFSGMMVTTTTTDPHGNFSFHNLGRGVYYVHASKFGYGENSERVEVVNTSRLGVHITLSRIPDAQPTAPEAVSVEHLKIPGKARKEYNNGLRRFREKGDLAGALKHFEKAVEAYPEFAAAYYWMGVIRMDLDELAQARASLQRAIEIDEKLGPAYFPLGALHSNFGDYAAAEETLRTGLGIFPGVWQGQYELARACFALEKLDCAEDAASRAEELNPQYARVYLLLAKVYLATGRTEQAISHAEKFLTLAGDDPVRVEVEKTLARLRAARTQKP